MKNKELNLAVHIKEKNNSRKDHSINIWNITAIACFRDHSTLSKVISGYYYIEVPIFSLFLETQNIPNKKRNSTVQAKLYMLYTFY